MYPPAPTPRTERLPLRDPRVTRCANCDIPVTPDAVKRDGYLYCCDGCAIGGPCIC